MLKKIGIPVMALAALLMVFSPRTADARVHIGVYLGAPAYTYAVPADPYAYSYPYTYPQDYYGYNDPYVYPAPTYVAPYNGVAPYYGYSFGWGGRRDHDRDWGHGRYMRVEPHFRGGHDSFRGGYRR